MLAVRENCTASAMLQLTSEVTGSCGFATHAFRMGHPPASANESSIRLNDCNMATRLRRDAMAPGRSCSALLSAAGRDGRLGANSVAESSGTGVDGRNGTWLGSLNDFIGFGHRRVRYPARSRLIQPWHVLRGSLRHMIRVWAVLKAVVYLFGFMGDRKNILWVFKVCRGRACVGRGF